MNIFVDLDGTLKTESDWKTDNYLLIGDKKYYYVERPFVKEFFQELSKLGNVFICTAASQRYGRMFVEKFGIDKYVMAVFSRDTMKNVKEEYLQEFIFIDNDLEMAKQKVFIMEKGSISFAKKTFIEAKTFNGDSNDRELLDIIKKCRDLTF